MRALLVALCLMSGAASAAPDLTAVVEDHILPGYAGLVHEAGALRAAADGNCSPEDPGLQAAYHKAFDAWISVSHLRFGPSELDDRAFALAFWPDPRGSTPKALAALIAEADPAVSNPEDFAAVSIAARGFYALEFLLFDPQFTAPNSSGIHCALVRAIATDIATNAAAIYDDWTGDYGDLLAEAENDTYRTPTEAARQVFTSLLAGLEFTAQTRLGRPMGSFDRPRPNRAEARRSGRSLRHVVRSLEATRDLARLLAPGNAEVEQAFAAALKRAADLDDPVFAGVGTPQGRLKVEVLQQSIDIIRAILAEDVGPSLGVSAGFNALDGD